MLLLSCLRCCLEIWTAYAEMGLPIRQRSPNCALFNHSGIVEGPLHESGAMCVLVSGTLDQC